MSIPLSVRDALTAWGPGSSAPPPSLEAAQAYTRRLARSHYENFPVATWLLPRRLRQPFYNVYAFCRWADDLGDETGGGEESLALLAWWREELALCGRGEPRHPVMIALRPTLEQFRIPLQPFEHLISAFEQDQRVKEYETFEQLRDYCRRSADPVGRIVLHLCEAVSERNAAWSDAICTGLQLANFWQDVARDYDLGRVYLPRKDRERFGYDQRALETRATNAAFLELMRFEVERARAFLWDGLPLADVLRGRLGVEIECFAHGGLAILREIERIGYRVWERRPVLTKRRLVGLLVRTIGRRLLRRRR